LGIGKKSEEEEEEPVEFLLLSPSSFLGVLYTLCDL
jgi:hypothetical protein